MGGKGGVASGVRDRLFLKGPRPHLGWRSAQSQPSPRSRHNPMGPPHVIPPTPQNHLMGPPYALFPPTPTVVPPPRTPIGPPTTPPPQNAPWDPSPQYPIPPPPEYPIGPLPPRNPPSFVTLPPYPPIGPLPKRKVHILQWGGGTFITFITFVPWGLGGGRIYINIYSIYI